MRVHFGDFLRHQLDQFEGPTAFAQKTGLSVASLTKWTRAQKREETRMSPLSALVLAKALGFDSTEALDEAWQATAISPYPRRANGRVGDVRPASMRLADLMRLRGYDAARLSSETGVALERIEALLQGSRIDAASVEQLLARLRRHNDPQVSWPEELIDESERAIALSQVLSFVAGVNDPRDLEQVLAAVEARRKVVAGTLGRSASAPGRRR